MLTYVGTYNYDSSCFPFIIRNATSNEDFVYKFIQIFTNINSIAEIKDKKIIKELYIFSDKNKGEIFWNNYFNMFLINYVKQTELKRKEEELKRKEQIWLSFLKY